jgi:mono/diheme cytochrome c family protein
MHKVTFLLTLAAILGLPVLLALTLPVRAAAGPAGVTAGDAGAAAGKVAFVDLKCSICHSVESQAIERKSKSEKVKGPDLSTIGTTHDHAWFAKFLRQEIVDENGKKHGKDFKGTPEQLEQIAQFLASLKTK